MPRTAAARPAAKKMPDKPARKTRPAPEAPLSRQRRPADLSTEEWQRALRRQYGSRQPFELRNLGDEPVFSQFAVHNPAAGSRYRVTIRGAAAGDNTCTCADFANNELGTCKHVEFTLARLAARRGGKAALARGWQPPFSEVWLHHGPVRTLRFRAGTDCPPRLLAQARKLFDAAAGWVLPDSRLEGLEGLAAAASAAGHELRIDDDALAFVAQGRDAGRRQLALAAAYPRGADDPGLAALLKVPLYRYQAEGALFAARAGRALIGDEMGLGKTVQAIAAAELLARHAGVERVLVVCPTSLKHQWQREVARFSGRSAMVLQGQRAARRQQYAEEAFCKITSYEALARDVDLVTAWGPELLIVDEAQRVKNWNTVAARAIRRVPSPHALVLTGTPLENRLDELVAIVQLVDPHRLGPLWRLRERHQQTDEHGRVIGYRRLDELGATLAPVLLRRRKAEVLAQLPPRVDNTLFVPLTAEQRAHHDENGDIVARIVRRWRRTGFLSDADQRRLTCALQNMRMSCNSTYLLDPETDHGTKVDELMTLLDELFETPGAKVVVFSQWLRTHELVARRLRARGWPFVLFHGGVPAEQRGALVDRFTGDPACRVFLSTDAGGVGLNLQHAAATVVNMDLPWNPAVLEQRIGRVHRMGQPLPVQVVNLVAQGSIEEGMLSVLAFKKSLFAGVLDGGASEVFMQGTQLARFMETVEQVAGAMGTAEAAEPAPPAAGPAASAAAGDTDAPGAEAAAEPAHTGAGGGPAAPATAPAADPWAPLLDAGLRFVEALAADPAAATARWLHTDAATGRPELRLPLPDPRTLQRLAEGLATLFAGRER